MRTQRNRCAGFTLVEAVIILVVLAILAAITVPAMSGWIEKGKEKRLIADCRECVDAARGLAVLRHDSGEAFKAPSGADVLAFSGVKKGSIVKLEYVSNGSSTVKRLTYSDGDGGIVTYRANQSMEGTYVFNAGSSDISDPDFQEALRRVMEETGKTKIDSGAAGVAGLSAGETVQALLALGIDLADLNAVSWQFSNQTHKFYWTGYDISTLSPGATVPMMRYNYDTGTFTVWTAVIRTVTEGKPPTTYNVLSEGKLISSTSVGKDQTYERMLADYQKAVDSGKY